MRKMLIILLLAGYGLQAHGQDVAVKTLYENEEYDALIHRYADHPDSLTARSLYYLGLAYYLKEDDKNAVKFMDLVIAKDPKDAKAHYIKGAIAYNNQRDDEAVVDFNTAIRLDSSVGEFYSELGDVYYDQKKMDQAMRAFNTAARKMKEPDHAYMMMANIYADQQQPDKALEAYYQVKIHGTGTSAAYRRALFNIGQMELTEHEDYDKAERAFRELSTLAPEDYEVYAKLARICYYRKDYDKAKTYKTKLYNAHARGLLEGTLDDRFCIDVFQWNGREIQVFERYQEGPSRSFFNKVIFYVNNGDSLECTVQLEYSALSIEKGGPKYLLCGSQGSNHSSYGYGFNDNFKYDELKNTVIGVLEKKAMPVASSRPAGEPR